MRRFDDEFLESLSTSVIWKDIIQRNEWDSASKRKKDIEFRDKSCNIGLLCSCGNGSGDGQGHGIVIYRSKHGIDNWLAYCPRCRQTWNAIRFYMEKEHTDFVTAVHALSAIKGEEAKVEDNTFETSSTQPFPTDYTDYYKRCVVNLSHSTEAQNYLRGRGVSDELAKKFYIGFDPVADPCNAPGDTEPKKCPFPRIIIPVSPGHYVARAIRPTPSRSPKAPNNAGAKMSVFNRRCLATADVVHVVEGPFDALSFEAIGYHAVASCGKNMFHTVAYHVKRPLSFCFWPDNDLDEVTRKTAMEDLQALETALRAKGCKTMFCNVPNGYKDINEWFCKNPESFSVGVAEMEEEAKHFEEV